MQRPIIVSRRSRAFGVSSVYPAATQGLIDRILGPPPFVWRSLQFVPFDSKASHTWLLSQDVPPHLLNDGLRRWLELKRLVCVLIVDVVSHAHELAVVIAAAQEDDSDADDLVVRDAR